MNIGISKRDRNARSEFLDNVLEPMETRDLWYPVGDLWYMYMSQGVPSPVSGDNITLLKPYLHWENVELADERTVV